MIPGNSHFSRKAGIGPIRSGKPVRWRRHGSLAVAAILTLLPKCAGCGWAYFTVISGSLAAPEVCGAAPAVNLFPWALGGMIAGAWLLTRRCHGVR
jgi:hypothetical protein